MADEVDTIEQEAEPKEDSNPKMNFRHIKGVGDKTQEALDEVGSHKDIIEHNDLEGHFNSKNINLSEDVVGNIRKHAEDQFERERVTQQELVDKAKIQKEEELEKNKYKLVGGAKYAAHKTGQAIKNSPERMRQAGRNVRNNFWSYAGKTAVGGVKGTGSLVKGTGRLLWGTGKVAVGAGALGLSIGKSITGSVKGRQKGSLDWVIWAGIIIHLLFWKVFEFNYLDPTYIMLNYFIVLVILLKNYDITILDRRKFGIFVAAYLFYRYLVPTLGPAYPWIFLVESLMVFIIVALLSDWWVAAAFFLQLGGISVFAKYFPWLNTGIGSVLFTKTPIWPPWWAIMSATIKTKSHTAHVFVTLYFSIMFFAILQGYVGIQAATTIDRYGEDISKEAGEVFEQETENNWANANWDRVGLCWNSYVNPEKGERDTCSKLGLPPDKPEDEDKLYRSRLYKTMQEQVTMEWFTEKNTMSVGDSAFMDSSLYVVSLDDDIGVEIECRVKNIPDSGNADPTYTKISSGILGKETTINCDLLAGLKEGNNRIEFISRVDGSQVDIESGYVFYTMEKGYFDGEVKEFLTDLDERDLYKQERESSGPTQAELNLYERRLLPKIIQHMEEKIRNDYKYYPTEKIGSRSEPGFIKVNINLNNNIPFVGIKKEAKIPIGISVENMFENGKILGVDSGVVEMPLWLEPSSKCVILNKNTEKISGSEHSYDIKRSYLTVDWPSYDYGFKNRKKFKSCELNVKRVPSKDEGFYFDSLNRAEIRVMFDYGYETTSSNILYVKKGALNGNV
ncbi:hypothetical protein HQ529_03015 [Candidatus Woesearchaeota archaeon]|nr:hypothetical protein [Candidatus Woesearchaeota archaeon]